MVLDRQHPWELNGNASFWAHRPRLVTPCGTRLSVLHVTNLPGRFKAAASLRATETCGWPGSVRQPCPFSRILTSYLTLLHGGLCPWSKRTAPPGARPLALKEGACGCTRASVARAQSGACTQNNEVEKCSLLCLASITIVLLYSCW